MRFAQAFDAHKCGKKSVEDGIIASDCRVQLLNLVFIPLTIRKTYTRLENASNALSSTA